VIEVLHVITRLPLGMLDVTSQILKRWPLILGKKRTQNRLMWNLLDLKIFVQGVEF